MEKPNRISLLKETLWMRCGDCEDWPNQRVNREFKLIDVELEFIKEGWENGWPPNGEPARIHVSYYNVILTFKGSCGDIRELKFPWQKKSEV